MRFLLDTHAFLWYVLDDPQLSQDAKNCIDGSDSEVLISPASYWEIAIKISLGKYALRTEYDAFWRRGVDDNGFLVLPIEIRHTSVLTTLPFHHRDPFDRLLVAQAKAEDISIISGDRAFDAYAVRRIW